MNAKLWGARAVEDGSSRFMCQHTAHDYAKSIGVYELVFEYF